MDFEESHKIRLQVNTTIFRWKLTAPVPTSNLTNLRPRKYFPCMFDEKATVVIDFALPTAQHETCWLFNACGFFCRSNQERCTCLHAAVRSPDKARRCKSGSHGTPLKFLIHLQDCMPLKSDRHSIFPVDCEMLSFKTEQYVTSLRYWNCDCSLFLLLSGKFDQYWPQVGFYVP